MDNNKWLMFKNYMHNDLNITRDDIQQWITEGVVTEAKKLVANINIEERIDLMIQKSIDDVIKVRSGYAGNVTGFKTEIIQQVVKNLSANIQLTIK